MKATTYRRPSHSSGMPLWKQGLAFCLGLLSLPFGFSLHERFGGLIAAFGMGLFYLIAQFLLLRGTPHAFLDMASVVILNCPLLCGFFLSGDLSLMLVLVVTLACSYVGAIMASIASMWSDPRKSHACRSKAPWS